MPLNDLQVNGTLVSNFKLNLFIFIKYSHLTFFLKKDFVHLKL